MMKISKESRKKSLKEQDCGIEETARHLASAAESSDSAIYGWATDGEVLSWNKGAENIYGFKAQEIIRKNISVVFASQGEIKTILEKVKISGALKNYESIRKTKDGKIIEISATISPIYSNGELKGVSVVSHDVTEHNKMKRELEESEMRYRLLVEESPEAIYILEDGDRIAYINEAGIKLFGAKNQADIVGKSVFEILHPAYHEIVRERIKLMMDKHIRVPRLEEKFIRFDGRTVDVEISAASYKYGGRQAVLVMAHDITIRKYAEEVLKENENRFRELVSATFEGVVIHADDKIVEANQAFADMYGYRLWEVIGKDKLDFIAPENREAFKKNLDELDVNPNKNFIEFIGIKKDGSRFLAESRIRNILYKGKMSRVVGIRNITERKQTEINLREYAERLEQKKRDIEAIIENLPVGIFMVRAETREPFLINQMGHKMLGRGLKPWGVKDKRADYYEVVKNNNSVYPHEELPLSITLQTGKPAIKNDIFVKKPEGGKTALRVSSAPIWSPQGKMESVIVVFEDITHEFEIDRAKSEFVSLVSHQLRTPLTAMNIFIELLSNEEAGSLNAEQKEYVTDLMESTQRMIRLVSDLLNISRIETGGLKIQPEPVDLNLFVSKIISDDKPLADMRKVQLAFIEPEEKLSVVELDPNLGRQVVHNLITNAIKYSKPKSKVEVRLRRSGEGAYELSVKDNGIGIPKADQKRIFEKFFRTESAMRIEGDGTGLGLYASKMIMDACGGKIWFESKEGEGSTFYVEVKAKTVESDILKRYATIKER